MRSYVLIVALLAACALSCVRADYVAAVSQHATPPLSTPIATKLATLQAYDAAAATARAEGAQLIAFAEFGLCSTENLGQRANVVAYAEPLPQWSNTSTAPLITPCELAGDWPNSPALVAGSCMARNHSIVTLLNVFETLPCSPATDPSCPSDSQYIYVVDLLFDEQGRLVAKYRKSHPAFIFSVNKPPVAEMVTYTTSFGVRFGMFVCFDIAFSDPAVELVHAGVKDFIYAAAIGSIGRSTVARLWSFTYGARVLLANNGANASAILLQGSYSDSTVQIPVEGFPEDSILVAKVTVADQ